MASGHGDDAVQRGAWHPRFGYRFQARPWPDQSHVREIRTVLKASKRNKFRFEFIPIKFEQESVLTRDVVFQGQRYRVGVPVNSQLEWKAYRFAYEYDFISRNRGFGGIVLEAKYTDVTAACRARSITNA